MFQGFEYAARAVANTEALEHLQGLADIDESLVFKMSLNFVLLSITISHQNQHVLARLCDFYFVQSQLKRFVEICAI